MQIVIRITIEKDGRIIFRENESNFFRLTNKINYETRQTIFILSVSSNKYHILCSKLN